MWEKKTPHWVKTNVNIDTNMWCQLNTQGAEKLLLSSSPSYYILPFFCKKEKKKNGNWDDTVIKKILILKYTTWLCLYNWNEVGQEKLICSQPHASYVYSQLVEEQNQNTTKYFHGIQ